MAKSFTSRTEGVASLDQQLRLWHLSQHLANLIYLTLPKIKHQEESEERVGFLWCLIEHWLNMNFHEFSWESEYDPKVFLDCLVLLSEGKQPTRPSKHPHHYFVFDDFPTDTTSGFIPQGRRPLISDAAGIEKNDLTVFWEGEHPPHLSAR